MKKKVITSLLIIFSIFLIIGCGKDDEENKDNNEIKLNSNAVVVYFSATGTTKKIAERIANKLNSEIIEIIPKEEYKPEDLNYNSNCRANKEQNDVKARPEIANIIDISKYDAVYLGYPIWWGTNPKIILTLLDNYDFTNKTIVPFCTSGSTEISGSVNDLRNYNSKLDIKDGKRFSANSTDIELEEFIGKSKIEINTQDKDSSMKVMINEVEYTIQLENNNTAKRLYELAPFEATMNELNGNEKYIYLTSDLPIDLYKPGHIEQGDVMLYDNNCLVIFYKSFETQFSYTKIGHIDNLPDLGSGSIFVKFVQ